jgi:integrase
MRGRHTGSIRKRPDGGYAVRVSVNGKQQQIAVQKILGIPPKDQHKRDAQRALLQLQTKDGFQVPNYRQTVADALDVYYRVKVSEQSRTLKGIRIAHNNFKAAFGALPVTRLTREHLVEWVIDARDDLELAPGTIDTRLGHLRAALAYAQDGQPWPLPTFPAIDVDNTRMVFFTPEEFRAIHACLPPPFNDLAMVGYLIGWRRGELLDLTWERADRINGELRLPRSKSLTNPRIVRVGPTIREILHRRWREQVIGLPYVFHHRGRHISGDMIDLAWRNAVHAAGLTDKKFHDLRRTAARNMILEGIAPQVVMDVLGHRTLAMLDRYAIRVTHDLERAADLADQRWMNG